MRSEGDGLAQRSAESPPGVAYVGLGSNLGDRVANLMAAVQSLDGHPALCVLRRSRLYETAPVGVLDQPSFLNAVVEIETGLVPEALLAVLKAIERDLGRLPGRRWGERLIDLDLLLYGAVTVVASELHVPHPELWRRLFVLAPLAELRPDLTSPTGQSIHQVIAELAITQSVRALAASPA